MTEPGERLEFRGGPVTGALPLAVFILGTAALVIFGEPVVEGMIIASMAGISAAMLLARDVRAYCERIFGLMANRIATVAVVCWLWAGAFSQMLGESGLVEGIVWMGQHVELTGAAFVVGTFLASAVFAVSVGTGLGTVVGFTAVMLPAGIVLGAHPAAVMGAIFSGAAFGDNLAPVSDTTIVSAATQEADVGGVVRSRLRYVAVAGGASVLLFLVFGGGEGVLDPAEAEALMADTADPAGLPMLIPAAIVFGVAVSGGHFLVALTAGIASALVVGPALGIFPLGDAFHLTEDGEVAGSIVEGAMALLPIAILTLLLVTTIGVMAASGFLERMMEALERAAGATIRGVEAIIVGTISLANLCVSVNTVAVVTAGPLNNILRKRHRLHAYRSANLQDTISCSFPYMLPWSATMVAAWGIQESISATYDFVEVIPWSEVWYFIFYGLVLFPFMIVAVITGFGRRMADDDEGEGGNSAPDREALETSGTEVGDG